jgi:hypothetical protein
MASKGAMQKPGVHRTGLVRLQMFAFGLYTIGAIVTCPGICEDPKPPADF